MKRAPDIILYNGVIRTQDISEPHAEAIAISDGIITEVGSAADIIRTSSSDTDIIDLEGRLALPGFIDTHFHFYEWALNYDNIDFAGTGSSTEMVESISKKAELLGKGRWILGQGFNESDWPDGRIPDRSDLDRAAPENPVCVWRSDLHLSVANSMALELAGIYKSTPDPEHGCIDRDPAGYPTGVLRELASNMIRDVLPAASANTVLDNMQRAAAEACSLGLTSIHDIRLMGGLDGTDSLRAWQTLEREKRLNIRCHVSLPGERTGEAIALGLKTGFGSDILKIGHLKFFADGGMGARTAWMTEKYLDAQFGMPLTAVEDLEKRITEADAAGLSVMVHAIGDRAAREIIAMFGRIEARGKSGCTIPHRIEHLQMVLPEDLKRLSGLKNVAVSCQPNNMSLDISMVEMSVGGRAKYAYNLKSIMETGVPVMLSSDAPVADPAPLAGIYSAVVRKRMDRTPENGWYKEQALSVEEAVRGYTITAAEASGVSHLTGSITRGKKGDIVVLERDIFSIDPDTIADTEVDMTIFDGKVVFKR